MTVRVQDLLRGQPAARSVSAARSEIRGQLQDSGKRLIVIDDDPTGTQTVQDVRVYVSWSVEQLREAFASKEPVFYISTNSRSLNPKEAAELNCHLGRNLSKAAEAEGAEVLLASRSDSTLRGHFPDEVEALASGFVQRFDGILITPALFEAGRYTIGDVHWVEQEGVVVPAGETEFARDPVFGYRHGDLRFWVEEKTGGKIRADQVRSISLDTIREGGPEAVAEQLVQASDGAPIIVNAACYDDLEVFVLGLIDAESSGKQFIYRCAASFVKARGGFQDRPLLTYEGLQPAKGPCLVVIGSYTEKTSQQLKELLESGLAVGVELRVDKMLDANEQNAEIRRVAERANKQLAQGRCVAIYTSRGRHHAERERFLQVGETVMCSLCQVVDQIKVRPSSVLAKGGITSIEIARSALDVKQALVLGQILEGVPVWRLDPESRWPGIPYVVFPGNVGDQRAMYCVVKTLSKRGAE